MPEGGGSEGHGAGGIEWKLDGSELRRVLLIVCCGARRASCLRRLAIYPKVAAKVEWGGRTHGGSGKTYYFRAKVVLTQATESHDERLSIKAVDAPEGMLLVSKSAQSAWKMKN
jgi:hypothetical protein